MQAEHFKPCCCSSGCYCAWCQAVAISAGQTTVGSILIGNEKETSEKLPKSEKMGASLTLGVNKVLGQD